MSGVTKLTIIAIYSEETVAMSSCKFSYSCRRIFHWFSYTLFIYNAVLGLLMAVVRLLLSTLFSLLLLIRMDRVVLMKGFELWDLGECLYVNTLLHVYKPADHIWPMWGCSYIPCP